MNTTLTQNKIASLAWYAAFAVASAIGILITMAGVLPLMWTYGERIGLAIGQFPLQIVGGIIFGLGLGLAIGIGQWLVLRGREVEATRWLIGSIVGGVAGGVVGILISIFNDQGENIPVMVLAFATLGALLGLGQYLAARSIARSPLWMVANAGGIVAAWFVASTESVQPVSIFVGAIIFGVVTAVALWWFAKQ